MGQLCIQLVQPHRSAFSIASPERMMDTPQIFFENVTPLYTSPAGSEPLI
jgi:hypothetical protein